MRSRSSPWCHRTQAHAPHHTPPLEIGVALTSFGALFMLLGVILFFDGALLALGNVRLDPCISEYARTYSRGLTSVLLDVFLSPDCLPSATPPCVPRYFCADHCLPLTMNAKSERLM